MFDIIADEIRYDGRTVATFLPNLQPTLRDMAEGTLYELDREAIDTEMAEQETSHREEIEAKDETIAELEEALEKFRSIIDKIDDGQTLLAQLEDARRIYRAEIGNLRKRVVAYQELADEWQKKHAALLKRRNARQ